jgi:hypothetical protein
LSAIQGVVKESGFKLLWLEARVRGILQRAADPSGTERPAVKVEATGQEFLLSKGTTEPEREGYGRLEEWLDGPSRTVSVRGRIRRHLDDSTSLVVRDLRLVDAGQ